MANTTITQYPVQVPGQGTFPGILITWTGPGTPPSGMSVQLTMNPSSTNWYGAWLEGSPTTPPWDGWVAANPTCELTNMLNPPIDLSNGPVVLVPTFGTAGQQSGGSPFASITIISGTQATANPPTQGTVGAMQIMVLGGGGGPA